MWELQTDGESESYGSEWPVHAAGRQVGGWDIGVVLKTIVFLSFRPGDNFVPFDR